MSTSARRPIARRRLLKRVRIVAPRLLWLVAPAGFGKTTFARSLVAKGAAAAVCECRGLDNVADFARRIIAALAGPSSDERAWPEQQQLPFAQDDADLPSAALQAWLATLGATTFIFEDAADLATDPEMASLFAQLLGRPHPTRRVIVASRTRLDVPAAGFAPPNEVLSFDANDLRFDVEEIRRIFGSRLTGPDAAHEIEEATAGWPTAVFVLANAAREAIRLPGGPPGTGLTAALADLRAAKRRDVSEYFTQEILERLDSAGRDALIMAASISHDVVPDLGREPNAAFPLADTPFVTFADDRRATLHPLPRSIVATAYAVRGRVLASELAAALRQRGDKLAAARLYLRLGEGEAAADVLAGLPPFLCGALSSEVAGVLAAFGPAALERHPFLWSAATLARGPASGPGEWLAECRRMYAALPPGASLALRLGITSPYAYAAGMLGCFEEGRAALAALLAAATAAHASERRMAQAFATMWFAAYDVWRGDPLDLDRLTRTIEPLLADAVARALWLSDVVACRQRMYGDRLGERAALENACEAATQSGLPVVVGMARSDAAFGAWLAGEDELCERHLRELEAQPMLQFPGVVFFLDCARGRVAPATATAVARVVSSTQSPGDAAPEPGTTSARSLTPQTRCKAYLMAAATTRDPKRAAGLATSAKEAADEAGSAPYQVITRVVLTTIDEMRFGSMLGEARRIAKDHRNFALEAALESLRSGSPSASMLTSVCQRFAYFRDAASSRLSFSLASLRVRDAGDAVALSAPQTAILTRIAFASEPLSATALGTDLWPEHRAPAGVAKAAIRRLRHKLGEGALRATAAGFVLGSEMSVDLFEAEQLLRGIGERSALTAEMRHRLERCRALLRSPFPEFARGWKWFAPYGQRVRVTYGSVLEALGGDALLRDDRAVALERAHELLVHDPCNERGCEIAMTVARRADDVTAALAEFRRYEAALRRERDVEPPERLRALLRSTIRSEGKTLRVV